MAYKYRWLSQALDDMSHEIGYVYAEFGEKSARKAESVIRQRVDYLCTFPNLGMNYEGLTFRGNEVRIMQIKKESFLFVPLPYNIPPQACGGLGGRWG